MSISRETDDETGLRWYQLGDIRVLSVTTVLQFLEEDKTGLEIWKSRNDGKNGNPNHQHLFWYSGHRGTLCHYQSLSKFASKYHAGETTANHNGSAEFGDDEEMWGPEETLSMKRILEGPGEETKEAWEAEGVPTDTRSIAYSVLKKQGVVSSREEFDVLFPDMDLIDVLKKDVDFFVETFDHVCNVLGISDESVVTVEKFLVNEDDGYGGQTDLVYEAPDGAIVVADLKTSSGLRQKHRLQSVAYSKAVEIDDDIPVEEVDRVEVIRVQPDKREWEVHSHTVPEHLEGEDNYTDNYWFRDAYGKFKYDSLEHMWEKFKELSEKAHNLQDD